MPETSTHPDVVAMLSARGTALDALVEQAGRLRDVGLARLGRPGVVTFSPKVFIPVTTLCQDRCRYCTFVDTPAKLAAQQLPAYLDEEQALAIAHQGARLGCTEALLTLGDRPEARWPMAREWLDAHGYASTIAYIAHLARRITAETGLLAHHNPGVMTAEELAFLRPTAPSMGMMLETTSQEVFALPSGAHYGSPDKDPAVRLAVLEDAGRSRIPFTTGLLIGIGESVHDRAESLVALRELHDRYGHLQEVIIQNFRAKPGTAMQGVRDADHEEYIAAVATARLVLGPDVRLQAPPNLSDGAELGRLLAAGVDDWGGVSPLTADHVNPERPWPQREALAEHTAVAGFTLQPRLTVHQRYIDDREQWIDPALHEAVTAAGTPRSGAPEPGTSRRPDDPFARAAEDPAGLDDATYLRLLSSRGAELDRLCAVAEELRRSVVGATLSLVVNRNLSTDRLHDPAAIGRLAADAWDLGATEICAQGTPPPEAPADVYEQVARAVKQAAPQIHLHAFRPGDVVDGAQRTGRSLRSHLEALRAAGVDTVTGTGAKILDEGFRRRFFPDDLPLDVWSEAIVTAHELGLGSTAVMVYGHHESLAHRIAHLRSLRALQDRTGGFHEFVPMPFPGRPIDLDDARAVQAVARLMLHGSIGHIQAPWPKLGIEGATTVLRAGADDLGGCLLDGRILPEAGAEHGHELTVDRATRIARGLGRALRLRSTSYGVPAAAGTDRAVAAR